MRIMVWVVTSLGLFAATSGCQSKAVKDWQALADRACACKRDDAACARRERHAFEDLERATRAMPVDRADAFDGTRAADRAAACLTELPSG